MLKGRCAGPGSAPVSSATSPAPRCHWSRRAPVQGRARGRVRPIAERLGEIGAGADQSQCGGWGGKSARRGGAWSRRAASRRMSLLAVLRTAASLRGCVLGAPPTAAMATLNQMHRQGRPKPPPPKPGPTFGRPQLKGVVVRNLIRKPKKPNSANRKCVRVRLSNGREVVCFVPGEGHNLQEHHVVLVQGGRTQDLPGVKLTVVRGKYDCAHVQKKK
uniref:Small ribosomal subunit protein uS12m n=3 Tax=Phasianidae TaxID=9005 RepID=A0A8V0XW97_CHICK|eukprot:XP_001233807.2 28S ribosomal protein S12, mitochondrial [Gallus gallus]